jgi:hypothetical protein
MAMANPFEFLRDWARENVNVTVFDDDATAKLLTAQCLSAARDAGIRVAGVIKAAGGNLAGFFLAELDSAVNTELDRLMSDDKS